MLTQNMRSRITFKAMPMDRVSVILREIASQYEVTVADLRGPSRERRFAWPRGMAYIRLRDETPLSYPAIGRVLGGRDHTTVLKGERAMRARIQKGDFQ